MFQFLLAFFGLTPEHRPNIFKQIHEIVFHGNGGYDWETVYHMPLWLRRTTFNIMKEYYDNENKEIENQNNLLKNKTGNKNISRPNIAPAPNYIAKAPKK
jgi:hypothetical protein